VRPWRSMARRDLVQFPQIGVQGMHFDFQSAGCGVSRSPGASTASSRANIRTCRVLDPVVYLGQLHYNAIALNSMRSMTHDHSFLSAAPAYSVH
jgi:hypothetical protein